jgi:hypothetical protein
MKQNNSIPNISKSEGVLNRVAEDETVIDYTAVPTGLRIGGILWNGEPTTFTARCPKCGRIGIGSVPHDGVGLMVHRGRATANRLEGIDYCRFPVSSSLATEQ